MPRISEKSSAPGTAFRKVLSHRPEIAKGWGDLDELMRFGGVLHPNLKEEVRRTLAQMTGCAFCASLGKPAAHHDDVRTAAAVQFVSEVGRSPTKVEDAAFEVIRRQFSDEELVELIAWTAFMFASEMFGAAMKLDPATPEQIKMYDGWLKSGAARYERNRSIAT